MTQKIRRGIALWLVFLWMSPTAAFSDGPTPEIEKEKAALLEMMAFVSELEGSQIPALQAVRNKAEALIERLRSKEDPSRKKDAELIDQNILKPIDALINMGRVLEACGRGEEPILSGLGRQFVRAMVERINIGECRDLQAIAIAPEIMMLARNVSQIEEASLSGKPRPKKVKVDDSKLFKKILEKSRDMAIVSYFKEYSKLQGEIHFDPIGDPVKVTQESADAYFRITGENIFEPETFKSFFYLTQEKRGVGVPLSQIHQARREEFRQSQKSSYEEFVKENREAYRQSLEKALKDLSQVKERVQEAEEKVRSFKHLHNARFMLRPDELTALESSTEGRVRRYEGPRLTRRGPYGGFYRFDEIAAPETETGRYDAYDGVMTLSSNPIDVDHFLRRTMLPPEMMFPPSPGLEEGERLFLAYLVEKGVSSDFSRARELRHYVEPDIENPREKFESFLNDLIPGGFSQFEGYLDSQLKSLREKSKSYQVSLDKDALTELLQKGLAQVGTVDVEGKKVLALDDTREKLAQLRARYEVLKSGIYRNFMVVRHDPEIQKMWENDEAKPISSDSIANAWQKYDASIQKFLKETLPSLKEEGKKDPKKQIKLALKSHPSAVLAVLLDDPRIEVAERICQLGDEMKVDEVELEKSNLTWGLGATLAVGASAALTYGMGPLFGYGLGFGAYGDAIFSGTATAVGGGHMLFKSIPDYQALAFEGEVMEDILLALGEGDPRDVADKMGEMNAQFAGLIAEGTLNAVGALGFIKAARNIPASLRAEAIRRELEALKRASQDAKGAAQAQIQKGLGREFDTPVYNGKRVYELSDDERIAYAEKVLGKPGVIKNQDELRNALLDAHEFNEVKLVEELLSRRRSLSEFSSDKIRFAVIAGKARRLQPFPSAERRALMENGIAGDEAFIKGTPREALAIDFEKGVRGPTALGRETGDIFRFKPDGGAVILRKSGDEIAVSELKEITNRVTKGEFLEVEIKMKDGSVKTFQLDQSSFEQLRQAGVSISNRVRAQELRSMSLPEPPKPPSSAARPPAEVPMASPQRVPSIDKVHIFEPPVTIRYLQPRLFGLRSPKVVEIRAVPKDLPVLFIDNEGFATPGFVVKSTEGSGTALRTGVTFVRGGSSSIDMNMEQIARVEPVLVTPERIYLRSKGIDPKVGDVVFYKGEGGRYRPALVIHKGFPTGGREQLVLGYLDPATGEIIEVSHIGLKGAISEKNRITTGEITVPENSSLRKLPEVKSPPPIKSPPGGKLDFPSVPRFVQSPVQKTGEDIIQIGSEGVRIRKGGVYTVKLGNDEFRGAYLGKIVTKEGKTFHYFDDGTNDIGRAIEAGMINSITKYSN